MAKFAPSFLILILILGMLGCEIKGSTSQTSNLSEKCDRFSYRQNDLVELSTYPVSSVNMEEVLNDPIKYQGKKISFVGKIESGFEYANLVDIKGNELPIWPAYQEELDHLLQYTILEQEIEKSEYREYVGIFEYGGHYGHLGGWQFQLLITEVYPYTSDQQQEAGYYKLYQDYITILAQAKKDIKSVINQWICAMKSSNIKELEEVYYPDRGSYQYLPLDITINDSRIIVENIDAKVDIYDATVKPERYAEPQSGGIGIYKLDYIGLQKYRGQWKIIEIYYMPDPTPRPYP
jgi:hypothetical protein